jgi:phosphomannomutase
LATGDILHLRPSGNAPELRCYAESYLQDKAFTIVRDTLSLIIKLYN